MAVSHAIRSVSNVIAMRFIRPLLLSKYVEDRQRRPLLNELRQACIHLSVPPVTVQGHHCPLAPALAIRHRRLSGRGSHGHSEVLARLGELGGHS
jgi:hypothetical protein